LFRSPGRGARRAARPEPGAGGVPRRSLAPDAARGRDGVSVAASVSRGAPPAPGEQPTKALRYVQVALRDVAQEHVFGPFTRLVAQQALEALAHFLARHEHPVGLQDLADHLVVRLDRLRDREIAVRPRAAARPQVERPHLEEGEVGLARLEQDDVALEARIVLVLLDAELQARVQKR